MEQMRHSAAEQPQPDFRHVRAWIFDLDNTLYHADNGIFAQIESRMTDYVERLMGLPRAEARVYQKALYRQYGTTLNGLMQEHDVDPEDYLGFVHDIALDSLEPQAPLIAALGRLPGRRLIFTNGCRDHAQRILARIGMAGLFDQVIDIRRMGFKPKPQMDAYAGMAAAEGLDCARAAMFDDLARNLVPARALGMTTVWLSTGAPWNDHGPLLDVAPDDIDHRTEDLASFLHSIRI